MFFACDDDDAGVSGPGNTGGAGGTPSASSGGTGVGGTNGMDAAVEWSDARIIQTMMTANKGEVDAANLAVSRAQDSRVSAFAYLMITDHSGNQQQLQALADEKGISPEPNPRSQALESEVATKLAELEATTADEFDGAYMESQVAMHQKVLTLIGTELLPNVNDAELESLLESTHLAVANHHTQAEDILADL